MKGRTLVIGMLVFILLVVGAIIFAMMSTINGIKEEMENEEAAIILSGDYEEAMIIAE